MRFSALLFSFLVNNTYYSSSLLIEVHVGYFWLEPCPSIKYPKPNAGCLRAEKYEQLSWKLFVKSSNDGSAFFSSMDIKSYHSFFVPKRFYISTHNVWLKKVPNFTGLQLCQKVELFFAQNTTDAIRLLIFKHCETGALRILAIREGRNWRFENVLTLIVMKSFFWK